MTLTRGKVYLRGSVASAIGEELGNRDLVVQQLALADDLVAAVSDPLCRFLVYHCSKPLSPETRRDFQKLKDTVVPEAMKRGVGIVVIVDDDDDLRTGRAWMAEELRVGADDLGHVTPGVFRPKVADSAAIDAAVLAQQIATYDPLRPLNQTVILFDDLQADELEVEQETAREAFARCPEDETLIKRAFGDYDKVRVRLLLSKKAATRSRHVFQIWPELEAGPDVVPFILKSGGAEDVVIELGNTRTACDDCTPFPYFAPLVPDRLVRIGARAAIVSHFVERATLLEDYIRFNSPALAIASIFDGPLRGWRSSSEHSDLNVGEFALTAGLIDSGGNYSKAYDLAKGDSSAPAQLLQKFANIQNRSASFCRSHGDLHLKNIFVRENSVEIVLIDFNRSGFAPASKDPAELEVSLAFSPFARGEAPIPEELILRLYARPLLTQPGLNRRSHPRALAIEQIRRQISGMVPEEEYCEMVAAHCMWYAGRRKNALAYCVADQLI